MFIRSGSISKSLFALAPVLLLVTANNAQAHVKWFCAYSVAGQPDGLANVLCQDFELLSVIAIAALLWGVIVDRCFIGQALNRSLDRVVGLAGLRPDIMVRAGIGLLMVSLWTLGGIILTPELTTTSPYLPWLQLAIAASLIDKRTLVFAAVGIVTLFGVAVADYGVFHMADYPIFLGIAVYFAAIGLDRTIFGLRPLDVLRWSLAITLMWASIEKWAYPEWTYPLFVAHPDMAMGFSPAYYMKAAGVVEFAMAFGLTLSPFARRCSAIMLAATFITAIVGFGKIDAIGHAGVIGVLFAVIHDDAKERASIRQIVTLPLNFGCALATFIGLYYVGHAALYGTSVL